MIVTCTQEIQETVLRLIRTADQLIHGDRADAEAVRKRLQLIDKKCEDFTVRLDARRKNLVMARNFFAHAQAVSISSGFYSPKLESKLGATSPPPYFRLKSSLWAFSFPGSREKVILMM